MKVSVVIPVLNERSSLPATIAALRALRDTAENSFSEIFVSEIIVSQIIVSDGGSTDGTADWVRAQPDLLLVNSPRGKGPQLNVGAARATGDVLLFLHADSILSRSALAALQSALSGAGLSDPALSESDPAEFPRSPAKVLGGAFYLRFAEARPRSLRFVAWGINLRARLRGSATGDQGIFVRREVFQSIGGAPDWPLFEDVELVARIKRAGKFLVLKTPLTVSGRRYIEHGVFRTALLIYSLRFAFWLGIPPHRLKDWFKDARGK